MTAPGPKPKPAELAEAQGNPGHRPIVKSVTSVEIPAIDTDIEPPIKLSPRGREIWGNIIKSARTLGFVKGSDARALARYCDHFDRWLKVREKVDDKGETYETESRHGRMQRINPDFIVMTRLEERMTMIEDRFGFSPSARQSILRAYRPEQDQGESLFPAAGPAPGATKQPQQQSTPNAPVNPLGMFAPTGRPN